MLTLIAVCLILLPVAVIYGLTSKAKPPTYSMRDEKLEEAERRLRRISPYARWSVGAVMLLTLPIVIVFEDELQRYSLIGSLSFGLLCLLVAGFSRLYVRWARRRFLDAAEKENFLICPDCRHFLRGHPQSGSCPACGHIYTRQSLLRDWAHVRELAEHSP